MNEFQWGQPSIYIYIYIYIYISRIVKVIPVVVSCIHEVSSLESV